MWFERSLDPAWGLFEGNTGHPPKVTIESNQGQEQILKVNSKPLQRGDRVKVETGGGGGFDHPFKRLPELVLEDYLDGYIDIDTALAEYGVVIDVDLQEVNHQKTKVYRNK